MQVLRKEQQKMEETTQDTSKGNLLEVVIDRERNIPAELWEDDQVMETCPVRVSPEVWQSFLAERTEVWEALGHDYPEDDQMETRRAEMDAWIQEWQPEPITLSERIQARLEQIREQKLIFLQDNEIYDEQNGAMTIPKEAQPMLQSYEEHQTWLARRRESLWEPQDPELQELDRKLWVAETLWQERWSPQAEIEDRMWDEAWALESALMARQPNPKG